MKNKTIAIIGSGFSGLSSAAYLAKEGYKVHVFEKNECLGGRARKFENSGFSLIWDQVGIGCQKLWKIFLKILIAQ
jgi:phytoene dehydrogenase-like protein